MGRKRRPTVFIETTVPSFYFETRQSARFVTWRDSTRRWWQVERAGFESATSAGVIVEIVRTPQPKAGLMLGLMDEVPVLANPDGLDELTQYYISQHVMPSDGEGDAQHLAFASLHGIEFLLTWNCRHLANGNKARHIESINRRLGLTVPRICTPDTLLREVE